MIAERDAIAQESCDREMRIGLLSNDLQASKEQLKELEKGKQEMEGCLRQQVQDLHNALHMAEDNLLRQEANHNVLAIFCVLIPNMWPYRVSTREKFRDFWISDSIFWFR